MLKKAACNFSITSHSIFYHGLLLLQDAHQDGGSFFSFFFTPGKKKKTNFMKKREKLQSGGILLVQRTEVYFTLPYLSFIGNVFRPIEWDMWDEWDGFF